MEAGYRELAIFGRSQDGGSNAGHLGAISPRSEEMQIEVEKRLY